MKEFVKKNLTKYHVIGAIIGLGLSLIYWWKLGQFTDYFLKNNIFAISVFGIAVGYISFDLIINAIRKNKENKEN
jgi:hypothetical protein